jgi:hypothetical protein
MWFILALLMGLSISLSGGNQAKAHDSERRTDINVLHGHVEAFYAENGYYPSQAQINNASWRTENMESLDPAALKDPAGTATILANSSGRDQYAYIPLSEENTPCNNSDKDCLSYTLTATLDNGATYSKQASYSN